MGKQCIFSSVATLRLLYCEQNFSEHEGWLMLEHWTKTDHIEFKIKSREVKKPPVKLSEKKQPPLQQKWICLNQLWNTARRGRHSPNICVCAGMCVCTQKGANVSILPVSHHIILPYLPLCLPPTHTHPHTHTRMQQTETSSFSGS